MTDQPPSQRAVLIAGPTASGKSALALALAAELDGTVINADSMQVYRDLRVITARPAPDEEARVPHRLYGHVDAAENYSVGRWCVDASAALAEAERAGRLPIVVGGTGLYFKTLLQGLAAIPAIPADVRAVVRGRLAADGVAPLYAELTERDPATAARLMPADRSRITRALEVVLATGRTLGDWHRDGMKPVIDKACAVRIFLDVPPHRRPLRRHACCRRIGRSACACGAPSRSDAAGDESAWRTLADPSSQWGDQPGCGSRRGEA
jgi:tRNA dimethylallyltransferase